MQTYLHFVLADGFITALRQFAMVWKLHPVLVNFTAALVPVSVGADLAARILKKDSLRATAWWTLFVAACVTPLTALAGWLFWMADDNGVTAMTVHKWLGTSLAVGLIGLVFWRWQAFRKDRWPSFRYLAAGMVIVGTLVYQGRLGGEQSFGSMDAESDSAPATTAAQDPASSEPTHANMPGMSMRMPAASSPADNATRVAPTDRLEEPTTRQ